MYFEKILFYLILLDSIIACAMAWGGLGNKWYTKHFRMFSRIFPMTRGWTAYYLILVIWIGALLFREGSLPF